jgi:glycosyltransferase involved in cell wall biosynthesis
MATLKAELARPRAQQHSTNSMIVCHCTTVHTQLKSRTYHRQLMPLADMGVGVQYLSPGLTGGHHSRVNFVALPLSRVRRWLGWPILVAKLLRQNASFYHFQDPQLLPVALLLKIAFRKRVVYDAYEDFPSIAAGKRSIPRLLRAPMAATVACAETIAALSLDGLITADPLTLRRFARRGKSKKLVFYNFPNLDFFPNPRPHSTSFDLLYRGGLSERTGTFVLLDALSMLANRPIPPRLLLIGYFDGAEGEEAIRRRLCALGLDTLVEIRGRIGHERMAEAIGEARIGVSPLLPVRKFQINIPVKIFEYWACGLPVVATDLAPMRPFFRDRQAGLLVRPGSATDLAGAVGWLLDHGSEAARMGCRGRQLVGERFNNRGEVHKLRDFFTRIANQTERSSRLPCSSLS